MEKIDPYLVSIANLRALCVQKADAQPPDIDLSEFLNKLPRFLLDYTVYKTLLALTGRMPASIPLRGFRYSPEYIPSMQRIRRFGENHAIYAIDCWEKWNHPNEGLQLLADVKPFITIGENMTRIKTKKYFILFGSNPDGIPKFERAAALCNIYGIELIAFPY